MKIITGIKPRSNYGFESNVLIIKDFTPKELRKRALKMALEGMKFSKENKIDKFVVKG